MSINRRLMTDIDFEEATLKKQFIRVFNNNQLVDSRTQIVRFDDQTVVTQSSPIDLNYYDRNACEFYVLRS
ncbi:hypothetical protein ACFSTH_15760 [Paenibacillus yanchengensis]|uniref:Uncharacterized protein n=1 Tax=Paenibacillus yanchengensis TaxID=2035833 RepID=A0ABW4YFT5_9BACL